VIGVTEQLMVREVSRQQRASRVPTMHERKAINS
jgi:hypothetical protein